MKIYERKKYKKERFESATPTQGTFLCNFYQLENPIIDEYGNKFWNSEGYYMAQRTDIEEYKSKIALLSKSGGAASRKARTIFTIETSEIHRIKYMRNAIKSKFDNNPLLKELLLEVKGEIIEKNYWHDDLFGVPNDTLKGANMLGILLMEYRDSFLPKPEFKFFE